MDDLISRQELLNETINNPLHPPYITEQDVLNCPSAQPDYTIGLLHDNSTVVWQPLPKKMVTRQERYEIEVGVCNSLNAQAGRFRYSDPWLSDLLLRAQETINKLLEKLGEEEK